MNSQLTILINLYSLKYYSLTFNPYFDDIPLLRITLP